MSHAAGNDLKDHLRTVVAVPVTPFTSNGRVDEPAYRRLIELMTEAGVRVLTPNGNTGEYYALDPGERRRVVELTVQAAPDALVVAGVGLDVPTATDDARSAVDAGADCLMVHQPVHPYGSLDGWVAYHEAIAGAVRGAPLVPYVRDDRIDASAFAALAERCPGVVGVKYAVPDPRTLAGLVADTAGLDLVWLCGLAESWAPFFAPAGSSGFTSGLATLDPHRSLRLQRALRDGDTEATRHEWEQIRRFEHLRTRARSQDNVSVVKEALGQLGHCRRDVRPPASTVSRPVADEVADVLTGWGLTPRRVNATPEG